MKVDLAFGLTGLTAELPEHFDYRLLEAHSAVALTDGAAAIEQALDNPIGCRPLRVMAAGRKSAAIAVCDITRPVPNRLILPPLLGRLEGAGIQTEAITILIATGLHRAATTGEIQEIVGEEIASKYRVVNHNAREFGEHKALGQTTSGTPVYIDRRFIDADLRITLGLIEPHLMAGYSGGRKLVAPGLAAQETIKVLHSPRFMRGEYAVEGSIRNNPLHRELLEIAALARHDFICDVALARNRRISGVFAGDPAEAHRRGVEFVARTLMETLPAPVDAVITSAAGFPLDLTFYQAIKGVTAAAHIVRPGGRILLIAACDQGVGAPEFGEMLRRLGSYEGFLERILDAPVTVDQWQLEKLALAGRKAEILFYVPGLPVEFQTALAGRVFTTIEAALQALTSGLRPGAPIGVIPDGPYVLARVAGAA
jgi:nickel-dependent lactate racemase